MDLEINMLRVGKKFIEIIHDDSDSFRINLLDTSGQMISRVEICDTTLDGFDVKIWSRDKWVKRKPKYSISI